MTRERKNWQNVQLSLTNLIDLALMPPYHRQRWQPRPPPWYVPSWRNYGSPPARQPYYPRPDPYRVPEQPAPQERVIDMVYGRRQPMNNGDVIQVGDQSHRNT